MPLWFGCASVAQLKPEDIDKIADISKSKSVIFLRMEPENNELFASMLLMRRGGVYKDGSAANRELIDDAYYANIEPVGDYFVIVMDPMSDSETWIVNWIHQRYKSNPNSDIVWSSYVACRGAATVDNIRFSVNEPGLYDLGVISYKDHVSQIGEVTFKYTHSYDKKSLSKYISSKFPKFSNTPLKLIEPIKFVNTSRC